MSKIYNTQNQQPVTTMHMVLFSLLFHPQFISAHLFLVYVIVSCDYDPLLDPGF